VLLDPLGSDAGMLPTKEGRRGRILTKKECKKLAREKSRQLEESKHAAPAKMPTSGLKVLWAYEYAHSWKKWYSDKWGS
jgi:hypothetical protein